MPARIPPPIIAILTGAAMWGLNDWAPLARWITQPWTWAGMCVGILGLAIDATAVFRFRRAGTTVNPMQPAKASVLVTGGLYRMSRNPMYLGLLLILIGWGIWLGSASVWLCPPLFVTAITVGQIIPEEKALTQIFGTQYLRYQHEAARWVGRRMTTSRTFRASDKISRDELHGD